MQLTHTVEFYICGWRPAAHFRCSSGSIHWCFLETVSVNGQDISDCDRLSGQWATGILLSPPLQHWIYRCVATTPGFFLHGLWLCNSYPQAWSSAISLAIRLCLWTPRLNIGDIPKDGLPWWMPKRRCCLRRARGLGTVARDPGVIMYKHRRTSWTWLSQWAYPSLLFGWPLHVVSQCGWVSYWVGPIIPASGIINAWRIDCLVLTSLAAWLLQALTSLQGLLSQETETCYGSSLQTCAGPLTVSGCEHEHPVFPTNDL